MYHNHLMLHNSSSNSLKRDNMEKCVQSW